ncbi:hypothetical protein JAAARDRAFT_192048 [Jaapia argillacea MUCL 33604]|uniref:Uncharacterized protein n=1 Tax=Jaapia argillacea MUCL 33604 TaxID=933084 RepID=A0A067Q071_9AGAM|nr:hypothetical protein JAAARDRAFT_192048 [Jaapia argillacea MUCL 33604]
MSHQLSSQLAKLTIDGNSSTPDRSKRTRRKTRDCCPLALPTPYYRVQVYGFCAPTSWLADFANKYLIEPGSADDFNNFELALYALSRIRERTGVKTLTFERGLVDDTSPLDAIVPREHFIPVLAVCSNGAESYYERPSQMQMELLSKIFEQSPRWWIEDGPRD